ncbi:helix-turn-helix domain-containing protein, partial [Gordonia paraffinivorans]|uniref:helix-turn-helix domain-containing protein n=1 Tax=Gordonia paraffinivorans TaxID=175628 RepID=UPI003FCE2BA9
MTSAYEAGRIPEIGVHHRLRIARETAKLSQQELADAIGISRQSVSNTESGSSKPRKITLNAWALATGVPVSWLEKGETPAGPNGPDEGGGCPHQGSNLGPAD